MWKTPLYLVLLFLITGCAVSDAPTQNAINNTPTQNPEPVHPQTTTTADLPNLGEAPELTNEIWLNTDQPLRLADLGGKVVLLDMWTFG